MSNTTIQIKRSSVTSAPTTLNAGEPAYSYLSDKLFIGTSDGTGAIAIGGKYFVDQSNTAYNVANAAFAAANAAGSSEKVNLAFTTANAAFDKANSANVLAYNTGIGANAYADVVGTSANAYATATFLPLAGGTITNDLVVSGNLTISGQTTYANTQTLLIGDNIFVLNNDLPSGVAPSENAGMEVNRGSSTDVGIIWNEATDKWTFSNDGSSYLNIASNTDIEGVAAGANAHSDAVGVSANAYADTVGVNANTYASSVGVNANTYASSVGVNANTFATSIGASSNAHANAVGTSANVYAAAVGVSANAYADGVGTAANTNAANASYLSTGTVVVARGGTGLNTITANAVLLGDGTNAVKTVSSSTEGHVLQINSVGVPVFGVMDGGSF